MPEAAVVPDTQPGETEAVSAEGAETAEAAEAGTGAEAAEAGAGAGAEAPGEPATTAVAVEEPEPQPEPKTPAPRPAGDDTPPDPAFAEPLKTLDEILGSPSPAPEAKSDTSAADADTSAGEAEAAADEAEAAADEAPAAAVADEPEPAEAAAESAAATPEPEAAAGAEEAEAPAKPKAKADEKPAPAAEPQADTAAEAEPEAAAEAKPESNEPEAAADDTADTAAAEATAKAEPAQAEGAKAPAKTKARAKATKAKAVAAAKAEPDVPAEEAPAEAKADAKAEHSAVGAERVRENAPELVGLYTAAGEAIEKQGISGTRAVVYLVLDRSGSMRNYYKDGTVQHLADQAVALSAHLGGAAGGTGTVPVVFFSTDIDGTAELDLANHSGRIEELHGALGHMGRTNYHTAIDAVIDHYKKSGATDPALVIFQTDGAPTGKPAAEKALCAAAGLPLFWQFIAFGDPEAKGFDFLRKLDTSAALAVPEKRAVDNTGFFHAGLDPRAVADAEVFTQLVRKFPDWLKEARTAGAVKG
ncbi:VWA domain-containing protein [Streptomyces sp. NA02950]|uniref:VWA domain-containing protein n=1 Tax=Streptomyces sp. NA02950 TaxID=2742137 RepID=UPI0020CACD15|nr:VWA domain-containing protein [Streptomyces sp. NA02950]